MITKILAWVLGISMAVLVGFTNEAYALPVDNSEITGRIVIIDHPVNMVFQTVPNKTVGASVQESITVISTATSTLAAGVLEIQFPAELAVNSTDPTAGSLIANQATFAVPVLAPGASYTVTFRVTPIQTDSLIVTSARYVVGGVEEGFVSGGEFVTAGQVTGVITDPGAVGGVGDEGMVGGVTTLPRTGIGPWSVAMLVLAISFPIFARKRFRY